MTQKNLPLELIETLLKMSKEDIYPEDFIMHKDIEQDDFENVDFIQTYFNEIVEYTIERLETRLAFMKSNLEEKK